MPGTDESRVSITFVAYQHAPEDAFVMNRATMQNIGKRTPAFYWANDGVYLTVQYEKLHSQDIMHYGGTTL